MNKAKYLVFDCETTSLDRHMGELLTAYFLALDEKLEFVADLDLKCKPNDGHFLINPISMAVNKIDLVEHSKLATTYEQSGDILDTFLKEVFGNKLAIPMGHFYSFDIEWIKAKIYRDWENKIARKGLDTTMIATFLQDNGLLPANLSLSLVPLCKHFGIETTGAHNAQRDVNMSVELYKKLRVFLKP